MIAVRLPLGKLNHLATSRSAVVTFCGRKFSEGVDEVAEIRRDVPTDLCTPCANGLQRRIKRGSVLA